MGLRDLLPGGREASDRLEPHEVFTPTSPPLGENNVYVDREGAQEDLARWVRQDSFPVVSGDYGVGKTSLVRWFFQKYDEENQLLYVPSAEGRRLSDIFKYFLEKQGYEIIESETKTREGSGEFTLGPDFIAVKAGGREERSQTRRLAVQSPTEQRLLEIINAADVPIIIDEMHKASGEFKEELASFLKSIRMAGTQNGRPAIIVLIGTIMDSKEISDLDPGLDRFIEDVKVARMPIEESRVLVETGFEKLGISIDPELVSELHVLSGGAPSILQSLCLHSAESARKNELPGTSCEVLKKDVENAVSIYMNGRDTRLADSYVRAIETQGPVRYRKQILHAIATLEKEYATMEDIVKGVSSRVGRPVPAQSLSGPLQILKSEEYGPILTNLTRNATGESIQNLTAFKNPMMKSYIRFLDGLDQSTIVDLEQSLAHSGEKPR